MTVNGFNNPPDMRAAREKWTVMNPQERGAIVEAAGLSQIVCGDDWHMIGNGASLRITNVIESMCKLCVLEDGDKFLFRDSEFGWIARGNGWYMGASGDGGPWNTDRETIVIPLKRAAAQT